MSDHKPFAYYDPTHDKLLWAEGPQYVHAQRTEGMSLKPLYLHPSRPEPARKPMTEEEIKMALLIRGFPYDAFRAGIRFAEKHHGIGINKSDPDSIDLQSRCRGDKP